jgi:hypothetical protein
MVTHQGCPQTPGGRIRALGFARMGARGRRRGPIPAVCHRYSSPVSLSSVDPSEYLHIGDGSPSADHISCRCFRGYR